MLSVAACVLMFSILIIAGTNPLGGSKVFSYFIMLSFFFGLLWYFRTSILGGELHFHQGFAVVIIEHFTACIGFSLFIYLYLNFINIDLLTRHKMESVSFLQFIEKDFVKTSGVEAYNQGLKDLEKITPLDIALDEFKKRFFILLFFVLLASFIMRRSPTWSVSK